ncbi:MAG TPA: ABC-type transport auxiliary lipoprotein family protein, partial [Burkholderiales bacterium]|nr:ABC-type transport auxiliary lipoprotein family protein [Burkholderiales bacterium]
MKALRLATLACATLMIAACGVGKPIPQANTYVIEPPPPAPAAARRTEILRVGNVRVAAAFAGRSLVYRTGEVQYAPDFYNEFMAEPGSLLGSAIATWLNQAGPFQAAAQPGTPLSSSHVLDAVVTELYGDFRTNRPPEAVMTIQFSLVDLRGIKPTVTLERT